VIIDEKAIQLLHMYCMWGVVLDLTAGALGCGALVGMSDFGSDGLTRSCRKSLSLASRLGSLTLTSP
jgi:hypothetical protein